MTQTQTPDANSFLQFWIIILFCAQIATVLVGVVNAIANRKQRREVSFTEELTPRRDFEQHLTEFAACKVQCQADAKRLQAELAADRKTNEIHASERSKTIFQELKGNRERLEDQISSLDKKVSGLEATTVLQNQSLARLDTKLDRIIENKLT